VDRTERASHCRIARGGEPSGSLPWEVGHVLTQRLDEQGFGKRRKQCAAPGAGRLALRCEVPDGGFRATRPMRRGGCSP
jgi:hypothetical protein